MISSKTSASIRGFAAAFLTIGFSAGILDAQSESRLERVVTTFTGSISTVSGTPFGLDSDDRTAEVTGSFVYDPTVPDTNSDPARGDYQQSDARLTIQLPDGSEVTGSFTPFLGVEDFSSGSDTFRYIDGPRAVGSSGGTMAWDGVQDTDIEFSLAISGSSSTFSDDSLPNPLPFSTGSIPPHTFSLKDGGGTLLIQLSEIASTSIGVVITESDGDTAVTEGGASDTFDVALNAAPSLDVVVTLVPETDDIDLGQGAGNPVSLDFTPGDATTPQTVTVSAPDDGQSEGDETVPVGFELESFDPLFDGHLLTGFAVDVAESSGGGSGGGGNGGGGSGGSATKIKDTWTSWYNLASYNYGLYSSFGDYATATALYYYYFGVGDYYFHLARKNQGPADYALYNGLALYYLYAYDSLPSYYYYLALAYYYYYAGFGDFTNAVNYYYALIALAS